MRRFYIILIIFCLFIPFSFGRGMNNEILYSYESPDFDNNKHQNLNNKILYHGNEKKLANQLNEENTVYEISSAFDLKGGQISIPQNCVLLFKGGSINNGIIVLSSGCKIIGERSTTLNNIHIWSEGTSNNCLSDFEIKNIVIENNDRPSDNVLRFLYCNSVLLDNVTIKHYTSNDPQMTGYNHMYNGTVSFFYHSSQINILNCKYIDCSYEGLLIIDSDHIVVDNLYVNDKDASSFNWSCLNIMRCSYVKVLNSDMYHKFNRPDVGSTMNFCNKHAFVDNCHFYGGCGIDLGDETAYFEDGYFDTEDVTIQNCSFNTARGAIYSNTQKARQKDIRISNCMIDSYYEKDGTITPTIAFALHNCTNFIATDCVIRTGALARFTVSRTNGEQDFPNLGGYYIRGCIFEQNVSISSVSELINFGTAGAFGDITIDNCSIKTNRSMSLIHSPIIDNLYFTNNKVSGAVLTLLRDQGSIGRTVVENNHLIFNAATKEVLRFFVNLGEVVFRNNVCKNLRLVIGPWKTFQCDNMKYFSGNIFDSNCTLLIANPVQNLHFSNNESNGLIAKIDLNGRILSSDNAIKRNMIGFTIVNAIGEMDKKFENRLVQWENKIE